MTKNKSLLGDNEQILIRSLDLSESEIAVYLATLELGEAQIQDISRKSGVKRTSIYNFIDNLKERRLLSEIKKGKRRLFSATSPHHLLEQQKSKVSSVEKLIPQLLAIQNNVKSKPHVSFYEGIEGIKEIYRMTLRDKQTIYAWEDLDRTHDALGKFFTSYPDERAEKNIPARCIDRDTPFAREFTAKNNIRLARESRFVSSKEFGTEINIFGNKVAFFSYNKTNPFGVVIDDAGIAKTLKIAWTELWDRLPSMPQTSISVATE
ncbi:MAG: helix-turn-helix domain-containing protein [bacterium]|nr:helix-turn-helix domain-containing protein [bacterium]